MNFKVMLDPNDKLRNDLKKIGIIDDDSSEYIITKKNMNIDYLQAKSDEKIYYINVLEIIYIESLGHDILIHTKQGVYTTKERLKQLEKLLDTDIFLRISLSVIINVKYIKRIEASIFQKFILHMINGDKVDVTRSYYYIFREKLNI